METQQQQQRLQIKQQPHHNNRRAYENGHDGFSVFRRSIIEWL